MQKPMIAPQQELSAPPKLHLSDILNCLHERGLKYYDKGRYLFVQCPLHNDHNPSAQIFKDDFFMLCHVCGRKDPYTTFPELRSNSPQTPQRAFNPTKGHLNYMEAHKPLETHYKAFNLFKHWDSLPWLSPQFSLHSVPVQVLHELGWRENNGKVIQGVGDVFIPYFSKDRTAIPFAQVRHLAGERRFTFLKDAKPKCYGVWNLEPGDKLFVVEGASDCAVLQYASVPWIGLPSSSSGKLLQEMASYCLVNDIELVYAGDKDEAGDKLKTALGQVMPFRTHQVPDPYKDWGEFLDKAGFEAVVEYGASGL